MYFNLKKSPVYKALIFEKTFSTSLLRFFKNLFLTTGALAGSAYLIIINQAFIFTAFEIPARLHGIWWLAPSLWLGLFLILTPIGLSLLFFQIFYAFYLKEPREIKSEENLAEFLNYDAAYILNNAIAASSRLKEERVSTDSLLFALLNYEPAEIIFRRLGSAPKELQKLFSKSLNFTWAIPRKLLSFGGEKHLSQDLTNVLCDANKIRISENSEKITMTDIMTSLFDFNSIFKQVVIEQDLTKNDLDVLSRWYEDNQNYWENKKRFWRLDNLTKTTPIGVSWTYGYPYVITKFTRDISIPFNKVGYEIALVNREEEVKKIERVLSQSASANVLLVGEEGVGKRSIINKLVEKIYQGKAGEDLNYKRILELDVALITSSSQYNSEIINTLSAVLIEANKVGNIILLIENLHNFVGATTGLGKEDISSILVPYLESSSIQIVATTDPMSFHRHIASNSAVSGSFAKITIDELGKNDVFKIVADLALSLEAKYELFFTYGALKAIVEDADKYLHLTFFPTKAVALLHEVAGYIKAQRKILVEVRDVHQVVTQKTGIPLGATSVEESARLLNLGEEMKKEIVGQEEAIAVVVKAMQRLRSGLAQAGKPAGVFLFVGPTGVGKTLTAKILAKHYFGSETRMIRFDMSEFQNQDSLPQLIGSIESNDPGRLTTAVRENPFSVLLFDEVEKTHKDILNIFLQVFDEGWLTDAFGRKVSFEQNIIIATSNAGANSIREMIMEGIDPSMQKERVIDICISEGYFRPELLNRFDEIVVFHPLTKEHTKKIAEILINKLSKRLKERGYYYKQTQEIIDYISEVGFNPQFGARPMNRAIQDKLETIIARKILSGSIQKGQEFSLGLEEFRQ